LIIDIEIFLYYRWVSMSTCCRSTL